jgi:hypothetical protein
MADDDPCLVVAEQLIALLLVGSRSQYKCWHSIDGPYIRLACLCHPHRDATTRACALKHIKTREDIVYVIKARRNRLPLTVYWATEVVNVGIMVTKHGFSPRVSHCAFGLTGRWRNYCSAVRLQTQKLHLSQTAKTFSWRLELSTHFNFCPLSQSP